MYINMVPSDTRRKRHPTYVPSPFIRAHEAKVRWLSNPGPHSNVDLTHWLEVECGIIASGGRR